MKHSKPDAPLRALPQVEAKQADNATRHIDATSFVCVVGSSAGGLSAMLKLFGHMPYDHMSFIVLQHLPPDHKSELARILRSRTSLKVDDIVSGTVPRINTIHVIPADSYLTFSDDRMYLHGRTAQNKALSTIDMCLKSLSRQMRNRAVAVILSGLGDDGTEGLRSIHAHGGYVFVQCPADAEFASMPLNAIDKANVDFCLPPEQIAEKLAELGQVTDSFGGPRPSSLSHGDFEALAKLVLQRCRIDLREYKRNTLERRLEKRMKTCKIEAISNYIDFMRREPDEAQLLTEEVFINVTRFFRDEAVFRQLKSDTFRRLVRENQHAEGLRVWCLGCSTGEEAYSLAITLQLAIEQEKLEIPFKIIASDIDAKAIAVARRGIYSRDISADMAPQVLERFFSPRDGGLLVDASIRKTILFSCHDVLSDPPFSNIDFISCRNLLIYFKSLAQHRCLDLIHYALRDEGTLLLGTSESIGDAAELFIKQKCGFNIYRKSRVARQTRMVLPAFKRSISTDTRPPQEGTNIRYLRRDIDTYIIKRFGEPGVVVTMHLDVMEVRGDVSRFLGLPSGSVTFNLLRFAPVGMHKALEQLVQTAGAAADQSASLHLECLIDDTLRRITLQAMVVTAVTQSERLFLIVFADAEAKPVSTQGPNDLASSGSPGEIDHAYVKALENEVHVYKERLEQAIDDREISLEETKYIGQEAQASHEELQSFIEELETSREEIQSSNEELTVVNQEYKNRMTELEESKEEVQNILQYGDTCLVAINTDFCIYRFSASAANFFMLNATLCGRSLSYLNKFLIHCDLHELTDKAIKQRQRVTVATKHIDGVDLELHVQPLESSTGREQAGCLLIFSILGASSDHSAENSEKNFQRSLDKNWLFSSYAVAIITKDLIGVWANLEFYRLIRERRENFVSQRFGSAGTYAVFAPEFCQRIKHFAAAQDGILAADELAQLGTPSRGLHVINVDKIGGTERDRTLIRMTFEEKHHE